MSLDPSSMHAAALTAGVTLGGLMLFHRGYYYFDRDRQCNVCDGSGLSSKIQKHFPKYKWYSAGVDHVLEGVSLTLGIGSVLSLIYPDITPDFLGSEHMKNYSTAALSVLGKKAVTFLESDRQLDRGDMYQAVADVTSVAGTWAFMQYVVNRV
jgi:hypothetical protein